MPTTPACTVPTLAGTRLARRRAVLDLPPPPPVRVIEYQVLKRYCPHCACWVEPALNLDGLVGGHGRMSTRIMALVAWLRTSLRLPVRAIQTYLTYLHGLTLSVGEISALLATVAAEGAATAAALKTELRASASAHLDETTWWEAGRNEYAWVMTNAAGARYFQYEHSRAGEVAWGLTDAHYAGTLCTDFYVGYNEHRCRHQRCWSHLLRDVAELEKMHGAQETVRTWVEAMRTLYRAGVAWAGRAPPPSEAEREAQAAELRARVQELGLQWAAAREHPTAVL